MRVFKFVGDTSHDEPNNPLWINYDGVYFALDKPTDVSDDIGARLEGHSHFVEVDTAKLAGSGSSGGGSRPKPAKKSAAKTSKKSVSKKKRASKKS